MLILDLIPLVPLLVPFRADSHFLLVLIVTVGGLSSHGTAWVTLVILWTILVIVIVLILQQVLVVDLSHVEVAELAVGVVGPVSVVLRLLRVELRVHLGLRERRHR